jgi:hypothetical protein
MAALRLISSITSEYPQLLQPPLSQVIDEHRKEIVAWLRNRDGDAPFFNDDAVAKLKECLLSKESIKDIHKRYLKVVLAESVMSTRQGSTQQGSTATGDGQNSGATLSEDEESVVVKSEDK